MPAMIVWPVSSSVLTWKVGSSSASRWMAVPSFSWSPLDDLPGDRERALFALVRVHLVDLADPLPAALDGVHHGTA